MGDQRSAFESRGLTMTIYYLVLIMFTFQNLIKSIISWKTHLNVGEGDLCIDNVKQGDLNLDREARRQLHVDEVLQLLKVSVGDR